MFITHENLSFYGELVSLIFIAHSHLNYSPLVTHVIMSRLVKIPPSLCIRCRGTKMLCGLTYCPIEVGKMAKTLITDFKGTELVGDSPPAIFVGRYGYPSVRVYPSAPPVRGDTTSYEKPGEWLNMKMENFLSMRLSLIRGGMTIKAGNASDPDRTLQDLQVMSLSETPAETYIEFQKPINSSSFELDDNTTPMGPWSPVKRMKIEPGKPNMAAEKAYYDTDLKANGAILDMYNKNVDVQAISKVLSMGVVGEKTNRKLVPTRWSITAVDKNVSDSLVSRVKYLPQIDEFQVFRRSTDGNLFTAILCPTSWRFEWGEAWFPGSTWNAFGNIAQVEIDSEGYGGRTTYPGIGGCYYASRLAVTEKFTGMGRSGSAILWREIYPNFNLPIGVWYVRENLREMFRTAPVKFDNFQEALKYLNPHFKVDVKKWIEKSPSYALMKSNLYSFG